MKNWEGELEELLENRADKTSYFADNAATGRRIVADYLKLVKNDFLSANLSEEQEIKFLKDVKPRLQAKLILFTEKFKISTRLPYGAERKYKFIIAHKKRVASFIDNNLEFLAYMKRGLDDKDSLYFLRKSTVEHEGDYLEFDPTFGTYYSTLSAYLLAYEELYSWLENIAGDNTLSIQSADRLQWSASKIKLIELGYALHATGVFGSVDIRQIMKKLEQSFDINLGNYYDAFLKNIRLRKIEPTIFLNELKTALLNRMDDLTENPKYK